MESAPTPQASHPQPSTSQDKLETSEASFSFEASPSLAAGLNTAISPHVSTLHSQLDTWDTLIQAHEQHLNKDLLLSVHLTTTQPLTDALERTYRLELTRLRRNFRTTGRRIAKLGAQLCSLSNALKKALNQALCDFVLQFISEDAPSSEDAHRRVRRLQYRVACCRAAIRRWTRAAKRQARAIQEWMLDARWKMVVLRLSRLVQTWVWTLQCFVVVEVWRTVGELCRPVLDEPVVPEEGC